MARPSAIEAAPSGPRVARGKAARATDQIPKGLPASGILKNPRRQPAVRTALLTPLVTSWQLLFSPRMSALRPKVLAADHRDRLPAAMTSRALYKISAMSMQEHLHSSSVTRTEKSPGVSRQTLRNTTNHRPSAERYATGFDKLVPANSMLQSMTMVGLTRSPLTTAAF